MVYATGKPCVFYPYRNGGKRVPAKVFRKFCVSECMGGSEKFVRECEKGDCPMHQYRFGKNPSIKGSNRERMAAIRPPGTLFFPVKMNEKRFSGPG